MMARSRGSGTRRQPPSRLAVSMHEAGHAVVQLANGPAPRINSIAVGGLEGDLLGLVETRSMWQPYMARAAVTSDIREQWRILAWRDVINSLAGPIAELRWRRYSRLEILLGADQMAERCVGDVPPEEHTDFGHVRSRLLSTTDGDQRANFVRAWCKAEVQVAGWWREILQIGRQLDASGRIGDEELLHLWKAMKAAREGRRAARGGRRGARASTN